MIASAPDTKGKPLRIGIVAGEASGDLLGSHLMHALNGRIDGIEFVGIGGPKMIAAGMKSLFSMEKLAVRGYVEVLKSLPAILRIRRRLKSHFLENPPDLFIGVDAPDFNFGLERTLKRHGIPTFHYVSPSLWAWRGERIHKIARAVSHMLVLFPFEKALYETAGIPATYVGHPLADMLPENPDRAAAKIQLKLPPQSTVVAMLPGSRQSELHYMADLFVQTAVELNRLRPDLQFLVPLISKETRAIFEQALYRCGSPDLPLTILFGHAHEAMVAADAVLVASGTATLEAALLKRPMVITYKIASLTWRMIWRKRYLPYVGLPNVLAGRFVAPELLQQDANAENLAQALSNVLDDKVVSRGMEQEFSGIYKQLRQGNAKKVAAAVCAWLGRA